MKRFKKTIAVVLTVILFCTVLAVRCTTNADAKPTINPISTFQDTLAVSIERGQHLVTAGACHDCHSPKIMTPAGPKVDSSRLLSGHPANGPMPTIDVNALKPGNWILFAPDLTAFVGPWGLSYTANLTSDSATGIGAWSETNFVNAIRKGRHMGFDKGRPIAPPMPWENYNNLPDDDLKSIFMYLKTVPAVSNRVHEPFSPAEVQAMVKNKKP